MEVVIEEFGPVVKTDVDVIIKDGDKLIYVQAKNGPDAFGFGKNGLDDTQVWVQKALKDLPTSNYDQIMYVTPDPSKIPPQIRKWFQELSNEGKQISVIPIPHL